MKNKNDKQEKLHVAVCPKCEKKTKGQYLVELFWIYAGLAPVLWFVWYLWEILYEIN